MDMKDKPPIMGWPDAPQLGKRAPIFYGSTPVPHPTNEAAKRVDAARVMRETMEA